MKTFFSILLAAMWAILLAAYLIIDIELHKFTIVVAMFFTVLYFVEEASEK